MIKFLSKLQIWRNREVWFGFYLQSSIFGPARFPRKVELKFAFGSKDWHLKYI